MEAADQISGLGDKITELGDKAKDAFLETQDATVKASTYLEKPGKRLRKQPESSRTYMLRAWEIPWTLYQMQSLRSKRT